MNRVGGYSGYLVPLLLPLRSAEAGSSRGASHLRRIKVAIVICLLVVLAVALLAIKMAVGVLAVIAKVAVFLIIGAGVIGVGRMLLSRKG